jgi:hypothetical protein
VVARSAFFRVAAYTIVGPGTTIEGRAASFSRTPFTAITSRTRFVRSNPRTNRRQWPIPSVLTMSSWTSGVAVAVSATVGGFPSASRTRPSFRYSGRKS